jgi:hypothetical protein
LGMPAREKEKAKPHKIGITDGWSDSERPTLVRHLRLTPLMWGMYTASGPAGQVSARSHFVAGAPCGAK